MDFDTLKHSSSDGCPDLDLSFCNLPLATTPPPSPRLAQTGPEAISHMNTIVKVKQRAGVNNIKFEHSISIAHGGSNKSTRCRVLPQQEDQIDACHLGATQKNAIVEPAVHQGCIK